MNNAPEPSTVLTRYRAPLILLFLCALTTLVYWPGLHGPFEFDDSFRITHNPQVQITNFSLQSLESAWTSLYTVTPPPLARQLTQLSFGINHVFAGLNTWAYKTTDLVIHLIDGLLLFLFSRVLTRAWVQARNVSLTENRIELFALSVAALWMLHPLNVSTVLYVNQRAEALEALFMLLAFWLYVGGRLALAQGKPGLLRILIAFPVAAFGILAKENAVLFPLYGLVMEMTLMRGLVSAKKPGLERWIIGLGLLLPFLIGVVYTLDHMTGLLSPYIVRSFDLEQRVLTETRVLWFYLRLMIAPSTHALGLFHDDFTVSTGLFQPVTTIISIVAWVIVIVSAALNIRRLPWFAFAVFFYLAGQSLESTIFPLELVFEHRNYLPMVGPVMLLARILMLPLPVRTDSPRLLPAILVVMCCMFATVTAMRSHDWRSDTSLSLSEAEHHPDSLRDNFKVAQMYLDLMQADKNLSAKVKQDLAEHARKHLDKMLAIYPGEPDALFGLIVLDLYMERQPTPALVAELTHSLRYGAVDPTHLTIGQFKYLTNLQVSHPYKLDKHVLPSLFDALLANPGLLSNARSNFYYLRARYDYLVAKDLNKSLSDLAEAHRLLPSRWLYVKKQILIELNLKHPYKAQQYLDQAMKRGLVGKELIEAESLKQTIKNQRQDMLQ